jgi:hypothetical protein
MQINQPPLKILGPKPVGGVAKAKGVGKAIFLARDFNSAKAKEKVEAKEREKGQRGRRVTPLVRGAGSA